MTAPVLRHYDPAARLRLETDASDFAIAGVVSHLLEAEWHPIAFWSRKMIPAECNYETRDKELLAVLMSSKRWRDYFEGAAHTVHWRPDRSSAPYGRKAPSDEVCASPVVPAIDRFDRYDWTIALLALEDKDGARCWSPACPDCACSWLSNGSKDSSIVWMDGRRCCLSGTCCETRSRWSEWTFTLECRMSRSRSPKSLARI